MKKKILDFFLSFPHILEIINSIAEMAPQIELDEFMQTIVVSEREKNLFKKAEWVTKEQDAE